MTIKRRTFLSGTAASAASISVFGIGSAKAAFTLKYANSLAVSHPLNIRMNEAAERIAKETNGEVKIRVFPSGQLGSDTETISQAVSGNIELLGMTNILLASLDPAIGCPTIGFAFANYKEVWSAIDGDLGAFIRGRIASKGLIPMSRSWDNGFRNITTRAKPIKTPEDLNGFKIRVAVTPMSTSLFQALGAAPTPINFSELYSALQTRIVDGQENPLVLIHTSKLYEVQKHLSLSNHMWDGYWCLANKSYWEKLPAPVREVIEKHINQSGLDQRNDIESSTEKLKVELAAKGMEIVAVDEKQFQEKLRKAGFYSSWKDKFGAEAWNMLVKYSPGLAQ
jgi:tripartite ATP-independent transporter DctP family solute receptor